MNKIHLNLKCIFILLWESKSYYTIGVFSSVLSSTRPQLAALLLPASIIVFLPQILSSVQYTTVE